MSEQEQTQRIRELEYECDVLRTALRELASSNDSDIIVARLREHEGNLQLVASFPTKPRERERELAAIFAKTFALLLGAETGPMRSVGHGKGDE